MLTQINAGIRTGEEEEKAQILQDKICDFRFLIFDFKILRRDHTESEEKDEERDRVAGGEGIEAAHSDPVDELELDIGTVLSKIRHRPRGVEEIFEPLSDESGKHQIGQKEHAPPCPVAQQQHDEHVRYPFRNDRIPSKEHISRSSVRGIKPEVQVRFRHEQKDHT